MRVRLWSNSSWTGLQLASNLMQFYKKQVKEKLYFFFYRLQIRYSVVACYRETSCWVTEFCLILQAWEKDSMGVKGEVYKSWCALQMPGTKNCEFSAISRSLKHLVPYFSPVQRHHIGDRSLSLCNMFLDEMAKQARNLITDICTEQCTLSDQVSITQPSNLSLNTSLILNI